MNLTSSQRKVFRKNKLRLRITRSCLFLLILINMIAAFSLNHLINQNFKTSKNITQLIQLGNELFKWSDYLTKQVRHFVVTTQPKYLQNYWYEVNIANHRQKVIDALVSLGATNQEVALLNQAKYNSDALIGTEVKGMKLTLLFLDVPPTRMPNEIRQYQLPGNEKLLTNKQKLIKAREIMFNEEYYKNKQKIIKPIQKYRKMVTSRFINKREAQKSKINQILTVLLISTSLTLINFIILLFLLYKQKLISRLIRLKKAAKELRA